MGMMRCYPRRCKTSTVALVLFLLSLALFVGFSVHVILTAENPLKEFVGALALVVACIFLANHFSYIVDLILMRRRGIALTDGGLLLWDGTLIPYGDIIAVYLNEKWPFMVLRLRRPYMRRMPLFVRGRVRYILLDKQDLFCGNRGEIEEFLMRLSEHVVEIDREHYAEPPPSRWERQPAGRFVSVRGSVLKGVGCNTPGEAANILNTARWMVRRNERFGEGEWEAIIAVCEDRRKVL